MTDIQHGMRGHGSWELTSYEWSRRTGVARFGYTHRWTGEHRDVYRDQGRWLAASRGQIQMESTCRR